MMGRVSGTMPCLVAFNGGVRVSHLNLDCDATKHRARICFLPQEKCFLFRKVLPASGNLIPFQWRDVSAPSYSGYVAPEVCFFIRTARVALGFRNWMHLEGAIRRGRRACRPPISVTSIYLLDVADGLLHVIAKRLLRSQNQEERFPWHCIPSFGSRS